MDQQQCIQVKQQNDMIEKCKELGLPHHGTKVDLMDQIAQTTET